MYHPKRPQELCDEAVKKDIAFKIEAEADLLLLESYAAEDVFVATINFAKKHGLDISRSGIYKVECQTSLMIFLAESEEELIMRIEEATRG